jgi:hypothetical protein
MEQTGIRGAESWQFFAFVFTTLIVFAFSLVNELPRQGWRIALKLVVFASVGYLTLFNPWVQSRLVDILHVAKGLETR